MIENIIIRSAVTEDEEQIRQLLNDLSNVWQREWRKDAVSIALESAGELAIVACTKKKIVGFACIHDVGFRAYLSEMAVAEKFQKSGIGSKLLETAKIMLSKRNCALVVADVYPPAAGFYRKRGWVVPKSTLLAKDCAKKMPNQPGGGDGKKLVDFS